VWPADRPLYRIHRRDRGAWWFNRSGPQRFDPVDAPGRGACHLAEQPLGAWVEVFRTDMHIDEHDVHARTLAVVALGRELRLADLTSRDALRFGVTGSLTAGAGHAEAQAFAARAAGAEFDGVLWHVRHDPAHVLTGVALFGPAGASEPSPEWPAPESAPISGALIAEAAAEFGYAVLPRPI
jgi:hypothetical protein